MALRVYIDGYDRTGDVWRKDGVTVTRELEGFSSRAEFTLLLPYEAERPQIGAHVVVRDDVQLFRNANRLTQPNWTTVDLEVPAPTWGAHPAHIGTEGARWFIEESAAGGYIQNRVRLVEHPLSAFGGETGAVERRRFVHQLYLLKTVSAATVRCEFRCYNGTAAVARVVDIDTEDGAVTGVSGDLPVYVDGTDAVWWQVVAYTTFEPAPSATAMPWAETIVKPGAGATTCCWQLSEVGEFAVVRGTWEEALASWAELGEMTWEEYAGFGTWAATDLTWEQLLLQWGSFGAFHGVFPAYLDRRDVSANELLGIIAETGSQWFNTSRVAIPVLAIDYWLKLSRSLVTETYTTQTDHAIITDLLTNYAAFLAPDLRTTAVSGLSFTWVKRPLTDCLLDVAAQTGALVRVFAEATLRYFEFGYEPLEYTFGDEQNLLLASDDLANAAWTDGSLGTATKTSGALPTGAFGARWSIADTDGAFSQFYSQQAPSNGRPDFTPNDGFPVRMYYRFYVLRGSATTTFVSGGPTFTFRLNADTGAFSLAGVVQPGVALLVAASDGSEWWECAGSFVSSFSSGEIGFGLNACAGSLTTGNPALTGSAVFCGFQMSRRPIARALATGVFRAFSNDNSNWDMSIARQDLADLANIITVQSDEAGTYTHTATDAASVAEYGDWEVLITDSALQSNAECQRVAEAELLLKAWPRQAVTITAWGSKPNLDVGVLIPVAQKQLLQNRAIGQVVQKYTLTYRNLRDNIVTLECAPYSDDVVVRKLQRISR